MQNKTFGEIFKPVFIGMFTFSMILGLVISVLSLFGLGTVTLNDEQVTGWLAFVVPLIMSMVLSFGFSFAISVWAKIGLSIYSAFKKNK